MLKKIFYSIVLLFQSILPVKIRSEKFVVNPYGNNPFFSDQLHNMLSLANLGEKRYEKMRDAAMYNFLGRCQSRSRKKYFGGWKTSIDVSLLDFSLSECTQDQQKKAAKDTLEETGKAIKEIEKRRAYRKIVRNQLKKLAGIGLFVAIFASICCLISVSFGNINAHILGSKIADTLVALALCDAIAIAGMIWAFIGMNVEMKKDFKSRFVFLWVVAIAAQIAFIVR